MIAKMNTKTLAKRDTNERGYMCDKCGDRGDVFSLGRLLCAICYLVEFAPERVDKLKRKII